MREIRTEIIISAPPDEVWKTLSHFEEWERWNPLLSEFQAGTTPGAPVTFKITLAGHTMAIKAAMLRYQAPHEICWKGPPSTLLGTLFSGEHWLVIQATADGKTRFLHGERFNGAFVPLLWSRLEPALLRGYAGMNEALKAAVETPVS